MILQSIEKLYFLGAKENSFTGNEGNKVTFFKLGFTDDSEETITINSSKADFCRNFKKFEPVSIIVELQEKRHKIIDMIPWEDPVDMTGAAHDDK